MRKIVIAKQDENLLHKKAESLGLPSFVFGAGQEKRLEMVKKHFDFAGKDVLDVGCGVGEYAAKFAELGARVWGVDVDRANLAAARKLIKNVNLAAAENLPFPKESFDLVFLHEVLEHVEDDKKALKEAARVLKPGGKIIIFVPNRLYPFETHGFYVGKKFVHKNLPLVNWLPMKVRNKIAAKARVYTLKTFKSLLKFHFNSQLKIEFAGWVMPALDKIQRRHKIIGNIMKMKLNLLEKSWFRRFGISIFLVLQK